MINQQLLQGIEIPTYEFLSDNGQPLGNKQMTGDYAAVAKDFYIKPASTDGFILREFTINIRDTGSVDAGAYGNGITLTNGIEVVLARGTDLVTDVIQRFTTNMPVKVNADWANFSGGVVPTSFGQGDNFVTIAVKLAVPMLIDGVDDQIFGLRLNDDFSGLNSHTAFVVGVTFKR